MRRRLLDQCSGYMGVGERGAEDRDGEEGLGDAEGRNAVHPWCAHGRPLDCVCSDSSW
jgi:hypothetical protein